ncbi:SpaA isopeptide-forming pilin-related protein [Peptoniphilus grossensis]|uniref:SpaA isopeptide-forming pilin-related protein n=1 Tax=Peptoniphilus grossensis TaxID=1465756 RepID=UPI004068A5B2
MNNILKRIMSLLLALLMVLEVFSPVAVSARTLLDEEENHNSIMSEPRMDSKSILVPETKPKKVQAEDDLFSVPAKKAEDRKETNKLQEAPAREKESSTIIETPEKESPAQGKEVDNTIIEAGRQREQKAEDKLNQAVERAKQAEQNAKASENLNLETSEIEKPGYKAWRVVNRIKAIYKDGKLDCQGLLIEVEDFKGNKKTLTYDDILKDKNIIVNKEIKEGLFGSSELIITTPGLRDIKIDVKVENMKKDKDEKSALSLNKDNSNKLEDKENTEEEGLLDKIKNFFADDEQTKGLEEDAAKEDAELEFSDLDGINKNRKGILIPQALTAEEEAIGLKTLEEYQENESPRFMFFRAPAQNRGLGNKKFTIRTRYETSNQAGPIAVGQFFEIHLDDRLTVNDTSSLKAIQYNGQEIATPFYDKNTNIIKYTVTKSIADNVKIPLNIDVDYDVEKIRQLDGDATKHSIKNSITGIGVTETVKLPETVVDDEGNIVNQIVEPGGEDVYEIVEQGDDYKVYMDAYGIPVIENGKLKAIDWSIRFSGTKDLKSLGLVSNATLVKGSGLKDFERFLLNSQPVQAGEITNNPIEGKFGIVKSKNYELNNSTNELLFNFRTPVEDAPQSKYVIDLSVVLKDKKKSGAVRLIFDKGYNEEVIKEETSKRVDMNNRTTILGEFTSENSATWTVTDEVSAGDDNIKFPLATRELTGEQTLTSTKMAVYGLDKDGKMVVKVNETDLNNQIPEKGTNPSDVQLPGRIAVYEYQTSLVESEQGYSLSGVNINKYQDIKVNQKWNKSGNIAATIPDQKIKVEDQSGNPLKTFNIAGRTDQTFERDFTLDNVKYFNINDDGTEERIHHKLVQELPTDGQYSYTEGYNYQKSDDKVYYILNYIGDEEPTGKATVKVVKTDSKDPNKKLEGAKFTLFNSQYKVELVTDFNGEARFSNLDPGTYTLMENEAPLGYKNNAKNITVTVANDGKVTVEGEDVSVNGGVVKTEFVEHDQAPSWPDYMNAMHYGKINDNGNIETYIYLKPRANYTGGSTNRDTRLNLCISNGTIKTVEVFDVYPNQRDAIRQLMDDQDISPQTVGNNLGNSIIGQGNSNIITGNEDIKDPFTNKTGFQLKFPKDRFTNDWGFLVKVTAEGSDSSTFSYDWLTDPETDTENNAKIQKTIGLSNAGSQDGSATAKDITINVKNEEFPKQPVKIVKVDNDRVNRNPLANATFILNDNNGKTLQTITTGGDGVVDFGNLSPGKYVIEEKEAPQNYKASDVVFDVTVGEDGTVTYKARFKNGNGVPEANLDYYIENENISEQTDKPRVTSVEQNLVVSEGAGSGSIGSKPNTWEAYQFESLIYTAKIHATNVAKGKTLKIQFDPNLNFKQYVYEIPSPKYAKAYFNYDTNLLTYVFNDNLTGNEVDISLTINGIIPDKYYATVSGDYNFDIIVDPDGIKNKETYTVKAYYDWYYDNLGTPPFSNYYTDIYEENGEKYFKGIIYYNALAKGSRAARTLNIDWISAKQNQRIADMSVYPAQGEPAFTLNDMKIYKVNPYRENGRLTNEKNMPLSFGVRPELRPDIYEEVFRREKIDPEKFFSDRQGGFYVSYDPSKIKSSGTINPDGHKNHPMEIGVPEISAKNEGYVIVQTFKVKDFERYKSLWRLYYYSDGKNQAASYQKGNYNETAAEQSGSEIPELYRELVKLPNSPYTPAKFFIKKFDEADGTKTLKGAVFTLTSKDGKVINRSTDKNGDLSFTELSPGLYTLVESQAPQGYAKSDKSWTVLVSPDGNVKITEKGIVGAGGTYSGKEILINVTNRPVGGEFVVYKKDTNNMPLAGAKFKITKQNDNNFQAIEKTSDPDGVVKFDETLSEGTYIIEETEAPAGYNKINKKWVLVIDAKGNKEVYNYVKPGETGGSPEQSNTFIYAKGTNWVDVKGRTTDGWANNDNRWTGWVGLSQTAQHLGTRIIAINKKDKYVIQRYVINPEAKDIDAVTTATIHREKPEYPNMDWYKGDEEIKIFTLGPKAGGNTDGKVTALVSEVRLADYTVTDITDSVKKTTDTSHYQESRLKLEIPETDKPIIVDVKVPYKDENGGVGTGMDWRENGVTYWKSDYYERVTDIKEEGPTITETGSIIGSYVSKDSLEVTNDAKTFSFKIKKVKEGNPEETIQGAVFKLTGPKPLADEKIKTTGKNGVLTFDGLKAGTYKLEEDQPAPGYEGANRDWTVTITTEGKVYIKENPKVQNASAEANANSEAESNAKLSVVKGYALSNTNANPELAMKMQKIKAATYGAEDEINRKSVAFKTGADKNEALVKENLNSIYGPDEITDKHSEIVSIKEMGMAAYTAKKTSANGLEISPEEVPEAQRAGDGWEIVDNTSSTQPTKREDASDSDFGQLIDTKIIEIDKTNNRYKQVFIYKEGYAKKNRNIKFHRAYDNYNISPSEVTTRVFQVPTNTNLANINQTSDIDAIAGKTDISKNIRFTAEGTKKIQTTNINTKYPGTILIEVETNYNENYPIGLGSNYDFNTGSQSSYGHKCWLEKSYANEAGIPVVKTNVDYTITFDGNGGQWHMDPVTVEENTVYELPGSSFIAPDGKEFDGWLVNGQKKNPGDRITVTSDLTVTAQWRNKAPEQVTVSFSPGEGSGTMADEKVDVGSNYILPANGFNAPNGKEFDAWSVNEERKNPGDSITVNADTRITALWKDKAPETYNITVNNPQVGGTVTVPTSAKAGDEVTITASPNEGYVLDKFTVTKDADGSELQVKDGKFTMPASNVTVTATFNKGNMGDEIPADGFAQITNKQVGIEFKVIKQKTYGTYLKDAEFELTKMTDNKYENQVSEEEFAPITAKSDENGKVTFLRNGQPVKLEPGYYQLKETKAPLGYKKIPAPWNLEVLEENGKLVIKASGPEKVPADYIATDSSKTGDNLSSNDQIKYSSKITNIDTTLGTYVERIYIDTRGYTGNEKINVQIIPKVKREEKDFVNAAPPVTLEGGVKTAYRTTYKIENPDANLDPDTVLKKYSLSNPGVTMVNTARWRPFDWGFDEDILNLDKGVYFIDIEGYFDRKPENRADAIKKLESIDINIDFYEGAREFQEEQADGTWKSYPGASYQKGNANIGLTNMEVQGNEKYPEALSKIGGRIYPPIGKNVSKLLSVTTSANINPLYESKTMEVVQDETLRVNNEEVDYNITFSKNGKDKDEWEPGGKEVAKRRLEGAIFKLQEYQGIFGWQDLSDKIVSSAFNGYFGFRGLKEGRYRLIEVKAPEGYKPIEGPIIDFTIKTSEEDLEVKDKTGKTVKIIAAGQGYITINEKQGSLYNVEGTEGNLIDYVTAATAKNLGKVINELPGKGKVSLTKVDEAGNALGKITEFNQDKGARFKLTRLDKKDVTNPEGSTTADNEYIKMVDENGNIVFDQLNIGHYRLEEIEPHPGHVNKDHVWNFTIGGKDLDPYADDKSAPIRNITDKITLSKSTVTVQKTLSDDDTNIENSVYPHRAQSLNIKNEFKINEGTNIQPGDYFEVKLTDSIDLEGIYKNRTLTNLDIFADGVGTVAKASYDKENGVIKYVFTEFARSAFSLNEFTTSLSAWVNLDKIKTSRENEPVGIGLNQQGKEMKTRNLNIEYDIPRETSNPKYQGGGYYWAYDGWGRPYAVYYKHNVSGKIFELDPETGEFTQYYYINRFDKVGYPDWYFRYDPYRKDTSNTKTLDYAKIKVWELKNTRENYIKDSMPESFAINENDPNLTTIYNNYYTNFRYEDIHFTDNGVGTYIVQVKGKIPINEIQELETAGEIWTTNTGVIAGRYDVARFNENQAEASAELSLKAVNPINKISFKKLDEKGEALKNAKFGLFKKNSSGNWPENPYQTKTSGEDGTFDFSKLEPGDYKVEEITAPSGYVKIEGPVLEFTVQPSGKIVKKYIVEDKEVIEEINTANPIEVVNNKPLEFIKVDATTGQGLKDAKFKLLYKEKLEGDYADYKVNGQVVEVTSGENGKFSLNISKEGYYALEETKAPEGYGKYPGKYIKEFKFENGKIQVLEKSSKQGPVQTDNNIISSQTIEINEKDKTFKQRIILNPNQKEWHFDGGDTQLRLYEENWSVNTDGKKIRYAVLDEGKTISDLKEEDFREFDPRSSSANPLMYAVARMYGASNYTKPSTTNSGIYTNKSLVVEFTGNIGNSATSPISIKMDVNSDQWKYSELTYSLDYDKIGKEDKIYVDYQSTEPIQVENRKGEYPWTGGRGTLIFTVSGLVLMSAAAYVYSRKRRASYDD